MMKYLISLLILISMSALAAKDFRSQKDHPCFFDFPLHCQDRSIPVQQNNWGCLRKKMNILSDKCEKFIENVYLEKFKCGSDFLTYCKGKERNTLYWQSCLKDRQGSLSLDCRNYLDEHNEYQALIKELTDVCLREVKGHDCVKEGFKCFNIVMTGSEGQKFSEKCKKLVKKVKGFKRKNKEQ